MPQTRFRLRQLLTLLLLSLGYLGYYYCRTVFAVIRPLLLDDYEEMGVDLEELGLAAAAGTLAYAAGKLLTAPLIDFVGGRSLFIFGLTVSVLATCAMGASTGLAMLAGAWMASQLSQSVGWGAMLKIVSRWFSYRSYGQVMGVLSLSYLFGDALVRWHLGGLVLDGYDWRGLLLTAAALASALAVVCWLLLRTEPPLDRSPQVNPRNLYGETGAMPRPSGLRALLAPIFRHPAFWMMLVASLGLNAVRETLQQWSATFLSAEGRYSAGQAGQLSAVFPLAGGVSALFFGWLTDLLPRRTRSLSALAALMLLSLTLFYMGTEFRELELDRFVWLLALSGLLLIGPYSLLTGAMALDMGARTGSSTVANLTDGVGYLGGAWAGYGVAALVARQGWAELFPLLAFISLASAGALLLYGTMYELRRREG